MILAFLFEIVFTVAAEFLLSALLTAVMFLAMGAITLLMELTSFVIFSAVVHGALTLGANVFEGVLSLVARALRAAWALLVALY